MRALRVYWAVYAVFQLALACSGSVDYFDSFDYLRSARSLAGAPYGYSLRRAPGVPLLHAPVQWALDRLDVSDRTRLAAPRLVHAGLSGLLLFAFHRCLPVPWAHWATIGLSLNRLVLHYFVSVLTDIPAALFLVLFWQSGLGVFLAAALLCRWNLPLAAALSAVLMPRLRRQAALGAALFLGALLAFYKAITPLSWDRCLKLYAFVLKTNETDTSPVFEPAWEYATFLLASAGPVVCGLFLLGLVRAWRGKDELVRAHGLFFLGFTGVMAALVGHKEARFLLPALPSFYVAAAYGYQGAARKAWLSAALVATLGWGVARELTNLAQPAFRDPILLEAASAVRAHQREGRVFWSGAACALFARPGWLAGGDETYSLFHVPSVQSTSYLLGFDPLPVGKDSQPAEGDLLLEAPSQVWLLGSAIPEGGNTLRLLRLESGAWRQLARWQR